MLDHHTLVKSFLQVNGARPADRIISFIVGGPLHGEGSTSGPFACGWDETIEDHPFLEKELCSGHSLPQGKYSSTTNDGSPPWLTAPPTVDLRARRQRATKLTPAVGFRIDLVLRALDRQIIAAQTWSQVPPMIQIRWHARCSWTCPPTQWLALRMPFPFWYVMSWTCRARLRRRLPDMQQRLHRAHESRKAGLCSSRQQHVRRSHVVRPRWWLH